MCAKEGPDEGSWELSEGLTRRGLYIAEIFSSALVLHVGIHAPRKFQVISSELAL